MVTTYLLLSGGLILLFFGGDTLVSGAVAVAKRLGVSPLLIGLTLVGFGTSTPELITSFLAVVKNSDGIAVGNIVGSNTANILLILGAASVLRPINIDIKSFKRDSLFLALATFILIIAAGIGCVNVVAGGAMVGLLVYYIYYSYCSDKRRQKTVAPKSEIKQEVITPLPWGLFKTVIGICLTILGAKLLVDNAIILARNWGISESVIGLSIVAVGTSLPELAASLMAVKKKETALAFGNIVGSNIYNVLFILGSIALFFRVDIPSKMEIDIAIMTAVTAALIGIAFWQKKLSRPIGTLFLIAYGFYIYYLYGGSM